MIPESCTGKRLAVCLQLLRKAACDFREFVDTMVAALGQEKNIYISCGFNSSTRHGDDITAQNAVRSDDADCAPKPAESGRDQAHGQHYEYWNQATLL